MIVIVDYGLGNLLSIYNMLKKVGFRAVISSSVKDIEKATHLILPGVGSFDKGMNNINQLGIREVLNHKVLALKTPTLGICLGMQLMSVKSEEGVNEGLGWIAAEFHKFQQNENLKVPHMNWNFISPTKDSNLLKGLNHESRFYFVHSYFGKCLNEQDILTQTFYGNQFVSAFEKDNIVGVQFHPEKSHSYGKQLLKNFITEFNGN